MEQTFLSLKQNLTNSKGLLDQLTYQGERNSIIVFNIFRFLNDSLGEIELELEKLQKENKD